MPSIKTILDTECIGDSRQTINDNFNNLNVGVNNNTTDIDILYSRLQLTDNNTRVIGLEEQGVNVGGGNNNFFILQDGSLRVVGRNTQGELGVGKTTVVNVPRVAAFNPPLPVGENVSKIYSLCNTVFILTTKGRVFGAGFNGQQQIGQGDTASKLAYTFINVTGDTSTTPADPIIHLAPGSGAVNTNLTISALTQSGRVYVWGDNSRGQAGIGSVTGGSGDLGIPRLANTFTNTGKYITAAGNNTYTTTYIVDNNNKLFVVGRNADGSAGVGTTTDLTSYQLVVGLPNNYQVNNIRAGGEVDNNTVWVTLQTGELYAAGFNNKSQVTGTAVTSNQTSFIRTQGFTTNEIVHDVAVHADSGFTTVWALIKDGTAYRLKGWGSNNQGQLGLGNITATITTPTSNPNWPWLADRAKVSQVVVAGNNELKTTIVLDTAGRLWAAGYNGNGCCGNPTTTTYYNTFQRVLFNPALGTPTLLRSTNNGLTIGGRPTSSILCLLSTGTVIGWGWDAVNYQQLGVDTTAEIVRVPGIVQIMR